MGSCDIFIACAAVADTARPTSKSRQKQNTSMHIELVRNPDIVSAVASHAQRPFTVGFAAETQDVIHYAKGKLEKKNLDMIIANDVSDTRIGFNSDENSVTIIDPNGQQKLEQMGKRQLAKQLIDLIAAQYAEQKRDHNG